MPFNSGASTPYAASTGLARHAVSRFSLLLLLVLAQACGLSAVDSPLTRWTPDVDQAWIREAMGNRSDELLVVLAFSGGGTRAAAFSYGVLQELAATEIEIDGHPRRFLDEIDVISGVSGGSFPAAYYGAFGDRIFTDFEPQFLRTNVEGALLTRVLWPPNWFRLASGTFGRSDLAARYYDEQLFHGATFQALGRPGAPLVVINATDLATGSRFGFTQAYFDLLCSDVAKYPLADACAASSAVPVLLSPITLKSYAPTCGYRQPAWLNEALVDADNPRRQAEARTLMTYLDTERRRYAHLVDGGIADNLGLRGIFDTVLLHGATEKTFEFVGHPHPRAIVIILVNAATRPETRFGLTAASPTLTALIDDVTSAQIEHYNFETIELVRTALVGWAKTLSRPGHPVVEAFVDVSFDAVPDPNERRLLNDVGTTFSLDRTQVDHLIAAGRSILRSSERFQAVVRSLSPRAHVPSQRSTH
jgi:NTE family protein